MKLSKIIKKMQTPFIVLLVVFVIFLLATNNIPQVQFAGRNDMECSYDYNHRWVCVLQNAPTTFTTQDLENGISFNLALGTNLDKGILQPILALDDPTAKTFLSKYYALGYNNYPNYYFCADSSGADYSSSIIKAPLTTYCIYKTVNGVSTCVPSLDSGVPKKCKSPYYYKVNLPLIFKENYNNSLMVIDTDYGKFYGLCNNDNCFVKFKDITNQTIGSKDKLNEKIYVYLKKGGYSEESACVENGLQKCIGDELYICKGSEQSFISQGKVDGKCGYSIPKVTINEIATNISSVNRVGDTMLLAIVVETGQIAQELRDQGIIINTATYNLTDHRFELRSDGLWYDIGDARYAPTSGTIAPDYVQKKYALSEVKTSSGSFKDYVPSKYDVNKLILFVIIILGAIGIAILSINLGFKRFLKKMFEGK